jgi:hypothetical protein
MLQIGLKEFQGIWNDKDLYAAVDKATENALKTVGFKTRSVAKVSCKTAPYGVSSSPGSPPNSHEQRTKKMKKYKDWIYFAYDKQKGEVVMGAVLLPGRGNIKVPDTLEHGGPTEFNYRSGKVIRYVAARPHMAPALKKVVDSNLKMLLENSIKT